MDLNNGDIDDQLAQVKLTKNEIKQVRTFKIIIFLAVKNLHTLTN